MEELYREQILEHYKRPLNFGHLSAPTHQQHLPNPSCGDDVTVELLVKDGHLQDMRFSGSGCAISQAATSLLSEEIIGKPLPFIIQLDREWLVDLLGINISPARYNCALLGLNAVQLALAETKNPR